MRLGNGGGLVWRRWRRRRARDELRAVAGGPPGWLSAESGFDGAPRVS